MTENRPAVPVPATMSHLPLQPGTGYPVPWFVAWSDGKPDFRVIDPHCVSAAIKQGRCWVCGRLRIGPTATFVIGPMCAINRTSAEPPSHHVCATYSATVCPFLTTPGRARRESGLPEHRHLTGGFMIARNPGVVAVWSSSTWEHHSDGQGGILWDIGDPMEVEWYTRGRAATLDEVDDSIRAGLPTLAAEAAKEGPDATRHLITLTKLAYQYVPED